MHACYRRAIGDAGRILSIGSGVGEHDVLLHIAGYHIKSTDLIPDLGRTGQRWFPDLPFHKLDALNPDEFADVEADCVLVSGLDYALDDSQLDTLFANVAAVLAGSGHPQRRFVFTLRYRDNALTRMIDDILLPLEARLRLWRSGRGNRIVSERTATEECQRRSFLRPGATASNTAPHAMQELASSSTGPVSLRASRFLDRSTGSCTLPATVWCSPSSWSLPERLG